MTSKKTSSGADNFMRIKNISQPVERRLHEAGIATYAELASLTPPAISKILVDVNGGITKQIIRERWIEQARNLSSQPASARSEVEEVSKERLPSAESKGSTSFVVDLHLDKAGRPIRTRVGQVEKALLVEALEAKLKFENGWDGWEGKALLDFITEHAGLRPPEAGADIPTATKAGEQPKSKVTPDAIPALTTTGSVPSARSEASAPSQTIVIATSTGGPTFQKSTLIQAEAKTAFGVVCANHPFKVQLALERKEIDSSKEKPLNYKASIYAKSLKGSLCQSIGEADGRLESTGTATIATIIMDGSPLPQGLYRLEAIVGISAPTSKSKVRSPSIFQTGERVLRIV